MTRSKACQSRTRLASKSNQLDERMSALARRRSIQLSRDRTVKMVAHLAASMAIAARSLVRSEYLCGPAGLSVHFFASNPATFSISVEPNARAVVV